MHCMEDDVRSCGVLSCIARKTRTAPLPAAVLEECHHAELEANADNGFTDRARETPLAMGAARRRHPRRPSAAGHGAER